jgi:hypothetical protein
MKKILWTIFMVLFFLSSNSFAGDRNRYKSSDHKFRSQFNANEWRENQARHESYLRSRHPEYYLDRQDRYHYLDNRDYYDDNDSPEYNFPYGHGYKHDSDRYDWNAYDDDWQHNDGYNYEDYNHDADGWDENEDNRETWDESD